MSVLRLLLTWLLLAALPLQGFAAASMRMCGPAADPAASVVHRGYPLQAGVRATAHAGHDHHQAHGDGHAALADASLGGSSAAAAVADDDASGDHRCAICATCSLALGVPQTRCDAFPDAPPSAALGAEACPVLTRAPPRPDKPPRG